MDFENKQNEMEKSSQEQKKENKENLEISDVINEEKQQLSNVVGRTSNENKQAISHVENYSGVESGDIEVAQEITAETNKEVDSVVENSKKDISEIVGKHKETNQEKYKKTYDALTAHITGRDEENIKQKFNLLDDESIQELDNKIAHPVIADAYFDANEFLDSAIRGYKSRKIGDIARDVPKEFAPLEKFNFIANKIDDLDNNGQIHGTSARQLTSLLKQVLKGEKTIFDLKEHSFTLGENKIPLSLDSVAENLLFEIPINNMNLLKRVAKSLDFNKFYGDEIERIEKGEYVQPEGRYSLLIKKANEIMGLTEEIKESNNYNKHPQSKWTDLNNPPTAWDKNAKVGDKIRQ